ncbi:aldehyde dehydrogenase family protein [Streptomyces clavifer]|uniref:aldehyde dehydrogenase family protein n=1 Tax=Streptomyces clavifer TaxID=68188 RepID=UPI00367D216A
MPVQTVAQKKPPKIKNIPFAIWGERLNPEGEGHLLTFPHGPTVRIPEFTAEVAERLCNPPERTVADLSLQEIVSFLNRVGQLWKNEEYARRRLYIGELKRLHHYSQEMAEAEADLISVSLRSHSQLHDMVAVELGHRAILDRWIPREDADVRAYPRGRSVHILPGNVPYSTTVSLLRALITKNTAVLKYAAGEPATALALAQSFNDVDSAHPVTRSVSAVFWERDNPHGHLVMGNADVLCAWGGADAIRAAYRHCSPEAVVVPYGPRRSLTVVGKEADMARAARGVAHDASMYEQRACFSTHQVFTDADPEQFADALQAELERYEEMLPRDAVTMDEAAQASLEVEAHRFLGATARIGTWGSIVVTDPTDTVSLPAGRVVFVHRVRDLSEVYPWVDGAVQTIGFAPWSLSDEHRDELARRGACRFVEAGLSPFFRLGGTHDGLQPLVMMTRMVSVEAPRGNFGKGMVVPVDQSEFLEHKNLRDLLV